MQKAKKSNFLGWNRHVLISSLKKIDLGIIYIVLLDFLFYILSGYLVIFWITRISEKMASFNLPSNIAAIGLERAQQISRETQSFYYLIIVSFIVLLAAIIFLASILKGMIWAKTAKTKLTFRLISKFFVLNAVWLTLWIVIIFLISWIVEPKYVPPFMAAALLTGFYLTGNLYAFFIINPAMKSVKSSISLSITKVHLFLLPYFIIFIGFNLMILLSSLIHLGGYPTLFVQKIYSFLGLNIIGLFNNTIFSPEVAYTLLILSQLVGLLVNPLLLLFAALARHYIFALAAEIGRGK